MRDATIEIQGMHCEGCAERVRTVLAREPGVRAVEVLFADRQARVRYNEHAISEARLRGVIANGGFEVTGPS